MYHSTVMSVYRYIERSGSRRSCLKLKSVRVNSEDKIQYCFERTGMHLHWENYYKRNTLSQLQTKHVERAWRN